MTTQTRLRIDDVNFKKMYGVSLHFHRSQQLNNYARPVSFRVRAAIKTDFRRLGRGSCNVQFHVTNYSFTFAIRNDAQRGSSWCLFGDETRLFSAFFSLVPSLALEREIVDSVIHTNLLDARHCVVMKGVYCSKYAKKASVIPKDK